MATEEMLAVCDRINQAMQETYGLTHPIVTVASDGYRPRLALLDAEDLGVMHNLALTIEHLCSVFAEHDDHAGQLRLF